MFAFILLVVSLRVAESGQATPSTFVEALEITRKERNTKSLVSHGIPNWHLSQRFPLSFSYFSNCPLKQELFFLGGPCSPVKVIGCGGFGCGTGIGFPISTVCCK